MGARLLRFGPFEIDLQTGELQRGTVRVSLQQQPFRILSMLLDRPGDVVSRDTIRSCLWPDGTHVDFDTASTPR